MKFSHSKLSTILKCPMTYHLIYDIGLSLKFKKPALSIGSSVHWGIEHNTEDLSNYTEERLMDDELSLSQAMIHGYFFHKQNLLEKILDGENDLEILEEIHELDIEASLKSYKYNEPHTFTGIIDLLLITNKGFILIDYKTSSITPNFNTYLDQLYRYIYLLKINFPDIPIYKMAIINIKKSKLRKLKNETFDNYQKRLNVEYEINEDDLINYYEYKITDLNDNLINNYIENLSRMCDTARLIIENKAWYINFNAINDYGGSDFKDIFMKVHSSFVLYNVKDDIYENDLKQLINYRDCRDIDIDSIYDDNILNKYELFESCLKTYIKQSKLPYELVNKNKLFDYLKHSYKCDDYLLEKYWLTFLFKSKKNK